MNTLGRVQRMDALGLALGLALALALWGCAVYPGSGEGVTSRPDGTAEIVVSASRERAFDVAFEELGSRGTLEASSREGGWLTGEAERTAIRVKIEDAQATSRVRIAVVARGPRGEDVELAQRIAGAIARRLP
jgi:hypothetical protein